MNHPPITLPNDIREAFERIAGYLRTVRKDRPHHERVDAATSELVGHVQTPEWIDGLLELAAEADRLANIADAGVGIPGAPDIGPDPLKLSQHEERVTYGSEYVARLTKAHAMQQPGVPDQTALVWRIDLSRVLSELIQTRVRERAHTKAVGEFLSELDAIMVDPLAEGEINVSEVCATLLERARQDREALNDKPRIYTRCPACNNDTLTINDHHLLCTWVDCPNPTMIDNPRAVIRAAWLRGMKLARSYGDNFMHCQGEERERHWKKFIAEPITDAIRGDLEPTT